MPFIDQWADFATMYGNQDQGFSDFVKGFDLTEWQRTLLTRIFVDLATLDDIKTEFNFTSRGAIQSHLKYIFNRIKEQMDEQQGT